MKLELLTTIYPECIKKDHVKSENVANTQKASKRRDGGRKRKMLMILVMSLDQNVTKLIPHPGPLRCMIQHIPFNYLS